MRNLNKYIGIGLAFSLIITCTASTLAQASRTWVSGVGDDVNPCSRTAPCKTFAGAISKTAAGGEIDALDPGGFGAVTITKSITINGIGTYASILVAGTNGITINAGSNDEVTIRNINMFGYSSTLSGINYLAGGRVNIENCNINNFDIAGINANTSASGKLYVSNTTISSSKALSIGINITPGSGATDSAWASINNVTIRTPNAGIKTTGKSLVTVSNSTINNANNAIITHANGVVNIDQCKISENKTAVFCDFNATTRISNSSIYNNYMGVDGTGKIYSFGNNMIHGNYVNSPQPLSIIKLQ